MVKRETLEEFLARGGKITKLPLQEDPKEEQNKVTPTAQGGGALMTLSEGSLFYSEIKPKVQKKKAAPTIDIKALPASLLKFLPNPKQEN